MKLGLIVILASLCLSAWAQSTGDEELKIDVMALDPDVDLSPLKDPRYVPHSVGQTPPAPRDELPSPTERDQIFALAGLVAAIESMDDLDRDILFRRAEALTHRKLCERYSHLPPEGLQKLQERIRQWRKP